MNNASLNSNLIILDRDGVINYDSHEYIKTPQEWVAIPGSLEAIAQLNRADYQVVIATNQSGLGRDLFDLATLESIHQKLLLELAKVGGTISGIFYCPHTPEDNCSCRKPKPGLLLQIASRFQIDLKSIIMVGDSERDVQAAQAVGCYPVLVGTGNITLEAHQQNPLFKDVPYFANLASFVTNLYLREYHVQT